MKNKRILLGAGVLLFIFLIFNMTEKKPLNWSKTYDEKGKNPFDLKIFYEQLEDVFSNREIITLKNTFYEYVIKNEVLDEKRNCLYINIDENYFPDLASEEKLLDFVSQGNTAFISANQFSHYLLDCLKVQTKPLNGFINTHYKTSIHHHKLDIKTEHKYFQVYFTEIHTKNSLGKFHYQTQKDGGWEEKINFIKIPHQKGTFYLHTQPEVFTNYHLLKMEQTDYMNELLSILPDKEFNLLLPSQNHFNKSVEKLDKTKLYFESNLKTDPDLNDDPLRFIKKHKALHTAWFLLLLTIGLFIMINSKRKQRIVPIITPTKNTSLEFIETLSALYEEADNFQPIIQQKINIFKKDIRTKYNVDTSIQNPHLATQLSLKSGYKLANSKELIRFIHTFNNKEHSSIILLKKLEAEIEKFYKNIT